MIKFDLRLNPETVEQIKKVANKDSRTVSAMARKILEDYFSPVKGVYWCGIPIEDLKGQDLENYKKWYKENYMPNKYEEGKGGIIYAPIPFVKPKFIKVETAPYPLEKLRQALDQMENKSENYKIDDVVSLVVKKISDKIDDKFNASMNIDGSKLQVLIRKPKP